MPVLIVIPARVGSTRLPNKPLQLLAGVPLIHRVAQRALRADGVDRIVVATDSDEVANAVAGLPVEVVKTPTELASGTDRVAAVSTMPAYASFDIVVNLQGDEPFLPLEALTGAIEKARAGFDIGTAAAPLDPARRDEPSLVKVVFGGDGKALYFSRSAIPAVRDAGQLDSTRWWQHLGVYAYRRDALMRMALAPTSTLERAEQLEQLRALEMGMTIGVALLNSPAPNGIDTPADLAAAEERWPAFAEANL